LGKKQKRNRSGVVGFKEPGKQGHRSAAGHAKKLLEGEMRSTERARHNKKDPPDDKGRDEGPSQGGGEAKSGTPAKFSRGSKPPC